MKKTPPTPKIPKDHPLEHLSVDVPKTNEDALVTSIELKISFEQFYQYLYSRNLGTLVKWFKRAEDFTETNDPTRETTGGAGDYVEALLTFLDNIHPHLEEHDKINSYFGLSDGFSIASFTTDPTINYIYLSFHAKSTWTLSLPEVYSYYNKQLEYLNREI
jgi:hypothetical protein